MKKISKFIYCLATAAFVAVSCDMAQFGETDTYTPGEPDVEGCYGVFIPTQDFTAYATLDPTDPTEIPVKVGRNVAKGKITVPLEIVCEDKGIFSVSQCVFEDGQEETSVKVSFPNAEIGHTYDCTVQIASNPDYVSKYSTKATFTSFKVTRVKWVLLGNTGRWRDDLVGPMYGGTIYAEVENLEVYEREDKPGYYKFINPYGPEMTSRIFSDLLGEFVSPAECEENCTDREIIVDATNPAKIYIPEQPLGTTISSADGEAYVATLTEECGFKGYTNYGTLKNGVITFPVKGMLVPFENDYSYYYGNNNGMLRICLPGAVLTDFTIKATAGYTEDGILPVEFTTGADVATIRFESVEGALDEEGISEKVAELSAGKTELCTEIEVEETTTNVELSYEKSGIYTIVAVSLDESGTAKDNVSVIAHYVAAGDEELKAVNLNLGINTAEKYRGINTETTLEIWAFSDSAHVADAKIGLFSYIDLSSDLKGCVEVLMGTGSASKDVIEAINTKGYIDIKTGLLPGTEYYLMIWASNGYEEEIFLSQTGAQTSGKPKPIYQNFTTADLLEQQAEKSADLFGTWNMYAVDNSGGNGLRQFINEVEISDSNLPDEGEDEYFEIKNVFKGPATAYGFDDTMTWDFYNGLIYYLDNAFGLAEAVPYYFAPMSATPTGNLYMMDNTMIGGFVKEGYIAMLPYPAYASMGYEFTGLYLGVFGDAEYSQFMGGVNCWYENLLFVNPEVDDNITADSANEIASSISYTKNFIKDCHIPDNFVETREGHIKSGLEYLRSVKKPIKVYGKSVKSAGCEATSVKTQCEVIVKAETTVKPASFSSLKASGEICRAGR